jgi:hypothetical protein
LFLLEVCFAEAEEFLTTESRQGRLERLLLLGVLSREFLPCSKTEMKKAIKNLKK